MPSKDRMYARQNLERSLKHIDYIQEYLIAVGTAFIEQGLEHYKDIENFPPEYQTIIAGVDALAPLCETLRTGITAMHDMI